MIIVRKTAIYAELVGIALGDGNLGKYKRCQYIRIYCNPTQKQYIKYVKTLLEKFFKKPPYEYFRKDAGVVFLEISKKNLDLILGYPVGSKIKNQSTIPNWIWKSKIFLKACLRGLFDTDGSIYVTGGKYKIVNYCSHNFALLKDIKKALEYLGFHPYIKFANVELGRMLEVERFYKIIKPANERHYRFEKILMPR